MAIAMSVPVYFLLLTFPENTPALNERERHIAINRFGSKHGSRDIPSYHPQHRTL